MKKTRKKIVRLNTIILPKVKVKSINDVDLPDRASNKFSSDEIRLCDVYIFR